MADFDDPKHWTYQRAWAFADDKGLNPEHVTPNWFLIFRTYLAEYEEPPVDPLADEAQELADQLRINLSAMPWVEGALLAALKRGMELARETLP